MRILIVCPFYPPENTIAAVRVAKFAEHWAVAGHEVKVLARAATDEGIAIPVQPRLAALRVPDPLAGASRVSARVSGSNRVSPAFPRLARVTKSVVKTLIWPDVFAPWAVRALAADLGASWRPDAVVASTGPFSSLLLGAVLAKRHGSHLVIDYRDLLASGPYYEHGPLRRRLDSRLEQRATARATLLAAVSQPMVDELGRTTGKPTVLVTNGFEPADFEKLSYSPSSPELRIAYCGMLYPAKRDPASLFDAVRMVRDAEPDAQIAIDFYGRNVHSAIERARDAGVGDVVRYHGQVSHAESLRIQAEADLLLLLLWNDPREAGVLSGKLFEYLGARRPILMLGFEYGDAAALIRSHGLGLVSNDPGEIARYLHALLQQKRTTGEVVLPGTRDLSAYTRASQSARFLNAIEAEMARG